MGSQAVPFCSRRLKTRVTGIGGNVQGSGVDVSRLYEVKYEVKKYEKTCSMIWFICDKFIKWMSKRQLLMILKLILFNLIHIFLDFILGYFLILIFYINFNYTSIRLWTKPYKAWGPKWCPVYPHQMWLPSPPWRRVQIAISAANERSRCWLQEDGWSVEAFASWERWPDLPGSCKKSKLYLYILFYILYKKIICLKFAI